MELESADKSILLDMLRRYPARAVLLALAEAAGDKAMDADERLKDTTLARRWMKVARVIDRAATVPCVDDV